MQDYGLVSIITPTWACASFICETIRSVMAQTYQNWELLIQDDCSTDGTDKVVQPYIEMDSRIKYECNPKNSGAAITRNNALRRAKGRWIAFLDSDDLWLPEKLEKQLKFMVENNYAFTYHNSIDINELGEEIGRFVTGPKKVGKISIYNYDWIGCLTAIYDSSVVGLVQIEDIKKNNDYAMWLKVCQITPCLLLNETLAKYRIRWGSISRHSKTSLIIWHYRLFRESEHQYCLLSIFNTARNLFFGVIKKIIYEKKY